MIVCHCQNITNKDSGRAVNWMRASDAGALTTPGKVYRALGKLADCGGCTPLFLSTMRKNDNLEVPMTLRPLKSGTTQETHLCKATKR